MLDRLKRSVRRERKTPAGRDRRQQRRDSYSGSLLGREVERASPDRAGEVAGHPVERVDT
jgi:hypothetical protein